MRRHSALLLALVVAVAVVALPVAASAASLPTVTDEATLQAQDTNTASGTGDSAATADSRVLQSEPPETGNISFIPENPTVGEEVTFSVEASDPEGDPLIYEWDFNGDGDIDSDDETPSFTYSSPGEYTVRVTVTDGDGESSVSERTITVADFNSDPSVSIRNNPTDPRVGQEVQFLALASDNDGEIESYEWTIGDEVVSTNSQFTYTFRETGTFEVAVTVTDDDGGETTKSILITPSGDNSLPSVSITADSTEPTVGQETQFTADASDPDGDIEDYEWTVDGEVVGDGPDLTYAFEDPGNHEVGVTVTDDSGAEETDTISVSVQDNASPSVTVSAEPSEPTVGQDVQFTAAASDPDGSVESYEWTVDGEVVSEGPDLTYAFEDPGDHEVTLTITDNFGAESTDSRTLTVQVENNPPSVSASAEPSEPTVGQETQFTADASDPDGAVESYEWTVDGEVVGDGPSLAYSFDASGSHEVSVTVTDADGAEDTATVSVSVAQANDPPSVSISAEPSEPTVDEDVQFTAAASDPDGSVESYEWTVDGEVVGDGPERTYSFVDPGDHEVSVTVTDGDGATASATVTVSVAEASDDTGGADGTGSTDDTGSADDTADDGGSDDGDSLLTRPVILGLSAGVLVLVLLGSLYLERRRSGGDDDEDVAESGDDGDEGPTETVTGTGGAATAGDGDDEDQLAGTALDSSEESDEDDQNDLSDTAVDPNPELDPVLDDEQSVDTEEWDTLSGMGPETADEESSGEREDDET